jgi:hypothetical protein
MVLTLAKAADGQGAKLLPTQPKFLLVKAMPEKKCKVEPKVEEPKLEPKQEEDEDEEDLELEEALLLAEKSRLEERLAEQEAIEEVEPKRLSKRLEEQEAIEEVEPKRRSKRPSKRLAEQEAEQEPKRRRRTEKRGGPVERDASWTTPQVTVSAEERQKTMIEQKRQEEVCKSGKKPRIVHNRKV